MELMTFEEAAKDIRASEHKRVSLLDKNGQQLVAFNSKNIPLEKRLNEIERRLQSKSTPAGVYQIHAKHYGNAAVPAIYYVTSGDHEQAQSEIEFNNTQPQVVVREQLPVGTVPAEQYNELYRENLRLEFELQAKDKTIADLEAELTEVEKEAAAGGGGFGLNDNTREFLQGSLEQVIPLVDKLLEQRDLKLKLQALELTGAPAAQPGLAQTAPGDFPMHGVYPDHLKEGAEDYQGDEITEEEETYIAAMENLQQMHPELYQAAMDKLQTNQQQNA